MKKTLNSEFVLTNECVDGVGGVGWGVAKEKLGEMIKDSAWFYKNDD